jgi:hypothetical protein
MQPVVYGLHEGVGLSYTELCGAGWRLDLLGLDVRAYPYLKFD